MKVFARDCGRSRATGDVERKVSRDDVGLITLEAPLRRLRVLIQCVRITINVGCHAVWVIVYFTIRSHVLQEIGGGKINGEILMHK